MARVEIYTKFMCPYCARAKRLLDAKGVDYEETEISMGGAKREEMIQRANGRTTVPQIFIDGRHVGGSDDLAELDRSGQLDPLLQAG
ncbi:MAG TPA: glutaredoxin 3 [Allosphingosinicella sp.]|jgi:glutaredoxin 3